MVKEGLQPKEESLVVQFNRSSKIEVVTQEEEDLTKEVEVEQEVKKLPFIVISATNWVIGPLNSQIGIM